jgi:glycosyltransferase involved in cell wall biosynthesis
MHVATMMGSGGLEKWLVDLVARMRTEGYESTIVVQSAGSGVHGERARVLGIDVVQLGPTGFLRRLGRYLRSQTPFDVVHSHIHYFSGAVLTVARVAGVPVRVAHAHNDLSAEPKSPLRRMYIAAMRRALNSAATAGFGVSDASARDLFGESFGRDVRWGVLPCGIAIGQDPTAVDGAELRRSLNVPPAAKVAVHVGRLVHMKNQEFAIRLVAAVTRHNLHLVLIGEGPDLAKCMELCRSLGIDDRVHFPGVRTDVMDILRSVADVFLLPSRPGEGAPIVLIEAQAGGVPCLISEHVQEASIVCPDLVCPCPLEAGTDRWVRELDRILAAGRPVSRTDAETAVSQSSFSLDDNVRRLHSVYSVGTRKADFRMV